MEKVQRNSIDKKQYGLKYSKNYKSPTLPRRKFHKLAVTMVDNVILLHD